MIKDDLKIFELENYDDDRVAAMSKDQWKRTVKTAMETISLRNFKKDIEGKTKTKDLVYDKLELQEYLISNVMNLKQKRFLLKMRTMMVKVSGNYGQKKPCPVCEDQNELDNQTHLTQCVVIKPLIQDLPDSDHSNIYGKDIKMMKETVEIFERAFTTRENVLSERKKQNLID